MRLPFSAENVWLQFDPLSANPQNGQTHSYNSSLLQTSCWSVFEHSVGLPLKGLMIKLNTGFYKFPTLIRLEQSIKQAKIFIFLWIVNLYHKNVTLSFCHIYFNIIISNKKVSEVNFLINSHSSTSNFMA